MKYIKTFERFSVNETMDMFMMPVDPTSGSLDALSDIGHGLKDMITDAGEFIWSKVTGFINLIIDWFSNAKIMIKGWKELFNAFWSGKEGVPGVLKNARNNIFQFLFNKPFSEVKWSDVNVENIKRVYDKCGDGLKTLFNFSDDEEKLKTKEGVEDATLKLKTWINTTFKIAGNLILSYQISNLITTFLISTGLIALNSTLLAIATFVLLFIISWGIAKLSSKIAKKLKEKGLWFKDVRDVKDYDPKTDNPVSLKKVLGLEDYEKRLRSSSYDPMADGDYPIDLSALEQESKLWTKMAEEEIDKNGIDLRLAA